MLRILNFSYINGKINDEFPMNTRRYQQVINKKPEVQYIETTGSTMKRLLATVMDMEEVVQPWSHY